VAGFYRELMNLPKIISRARFKSGITDTTTVTYTELSALCFEANKIIEREVVKVNQDYFEEQKAKFSLVANSGLYSLPTDCLAIKQLRLAYTTPTAETDYKIAIPRDVSEIVEADLQEDNISSSTPNYDITNNYYRIWPKPTVASTNGGELYYFATTVLSGSATPAYPVEYHELVSTYAAKEACLKFDRWDKYTVLQREWVEGIGKIKDQLAVRDTNQSMRLRSVLEDGSAHKTTELFG
jgi:hypothetical protein